MAAGAPRRVASTRKTFVTVETTRRLDSMVVHTVVHWADGRVLDAKRAASVARVNGREPVVRYRVATAGREKRLHHGAGR